MRSNNPITVTTALLFLVGGASVTIAQTAVPVVDEHHLEEPAEDGSIVAEIVTVDGSLVQELALNRYPGLFREID